jgi:hypothetical protein
MKWINQAHDKDQWSAPVNTEPSGYIKRWEILKRLSDLQLLVKCSAAWSLSAVGHVLRPLGHHHVLVT